MGAVEQAALAAVPPSLGGFGDRIPVVFGAWPLITLLWQSCTQALLSQPRELSMLPLEAVAWKTGHRVWQLRVGGLWRRFGMHRWTGDPPPPTQRPYLLEDFLGDLELERMC